MVNKDKTDSFYIKTGSSIVIQSTKTNIQYQSLLVGIVPNEYIIIKTPVEAQGTNHIPAVKLWNSGKEIIIRCLSNGIIYKFQSTIIGTISIPKNLIFLSFPVNIYKHELRQHKRVECIIPCKVLINSILLSGFITDISSKGCGIKIDLQDNPANDTGEIKLTSEIQLTFSLIPGADMQTTKCGIRNVKKDTKLIQLGLEFDIALEDFDQQILHYY